jgi:hypothetical protein
MKKKVIQKPIATPTKVPMMDKAFPMPSKKGPKGKGKGKGCM